MLQAMMEMLSCIMSGNKASATVCRSQHLHGNKAYRKNLQRNGVHRQHWNISYLQKLCLLACPGCSQPESVWFGELNRPRLFEVYMLPAALHARCGVGCHSTACFCDIVTPQLYPSCSTGKYCMWVMKRCHAQ